MSAWARIQSGDIVHLRNKRVTDRQLTVTVAETLPPACPDGRGFRRTDGEIYRFILIEGAD